MPQIRTAGWKWLKIAWLTRKHVTLTRVTLCTVDRWTWIELQCRREKRKKGEKTHKMTFCNQFVLDISPLLGGGNCHTLVTQMTPLAQVDTYGKGDYAVVVTASILYRLHWRCSSALLCAYGCYYDNNTGTTHKNPTLKWPPRVYLWLIIIIINSFDHENKNNWKRQQTCRQEVHAHSVLYTLIRTHYNYGIVHTFTHVHTHTHTRIYTQPILNTVGGIVQ
jgi:hypothetical protein